MNKTIQDIIIAILIISNVFFAYYIYVHTQEHKALNDELNARANIIKALTTAQLPQVRDTNIPVLQYLLDEINKINKRFDE